MFDLFFFSSHLISTIASEVGNMFSILQRRKLKFMDVVSKVTELVRDGAEIYSWVDGLRTSPCNHCVFCTHDWYRECVHEH